MKKLARIIAAVLLMALVAGGQASAAWNPFGGVDCSGRAKDSAVCHDRNNSNNPLAGDGGLLLNIVNLLAIVAGIAAVIIIVLAGLRFIQAGGNSEDIAGARRSIIYAVVGLVVIALARWIIVLIIGNL
jgi:hypothetical protein